MWRHTCDVLRFQRRRRFLHVGVATVKIQDVAGVPAALGSSPRAVGGGGGGGDDDDAFHQVAVALASGRLDPVELSPARGAAAEDMRTFNR